MKRLFCFLFACSLVAVAMADDGGASYPEDWTYGNIYVKEPNNSIALEKEYMYVSGEKIEAVFCFRNTTDSTVVVPCAFPIVIELPCWLDGNTDTIAIGNWRTVNDTSLWKIALDKDVRFNCNKYNLKLQMTEQEIEKYDKRLRVLTYSEYQALYKQCIEKIENDGYYKGCVIVQDGNAIDLRNVGIETNIKIKEGKVDLVLHFYHELLFPPNSLSKVCIDYSVNSLDDSYYQDSYELYYDISTGRTWKDGVIGSFVLLTDYNIQDGEYPFDKKKEVEGLLNTRIIPYNVYCVRNYKPVGRFRFFGNDSVGNKKWGRRFPGDKCWYPTEYKELEHFSLNEANISSYCIKNEYAKSFMPFVVDSIIKFNINESCIGPFVANGLVSTENTEINRVLFGNNYIGEEPNLPIFQKDRLWQNYSRIKTAILTKEEEGRSDTLQLDDRFPAYPYEVNSNFNDGWFGSNAVRNVRLLRPGSYTLTVNDIYKGDLTESVGVSHIWFYPVDKTLVSIIDEDKNSAMPLFSDVWKILNVTVDGVKPNWNDEDENGSDSIEIEEQEQKQESPAEQQVVKTDADESKSAVLFVVVALVALSVLAVVIVVVRKRKSRSK